MSRHSILHQVQDSDMERGTVDARRQFSLLQTQPCLNSSTAHQSHSRNLGTVTSLPHDTKPLYQSQASESPNILLYDQENPFFSAHGRCPPFYQSLLI